jgi:hypothetical protein
MLPSKAYNFSTWTNFPVLNRYPEYVDENPTLPKQLWLLDVIDVERLRILIQEMAAMQRSLRMRHDTINQSTLAHNAMILRVSRLFLVMLTEGINDAGVEAARVMDHNWTSEVARSYTATYGCSVVMCLCSRSIVTGESKVYINSGLLQDFAIAHLRSLGLQMTSR